MAETAVSAHSPYVTIKVRIQSFVVETEALVDTGFAGGFLLPPLRIPSVEASDMTRSFVVGDGRLVPLPVYFGEVEVVGLSKPVRTLIGVGAAEILLGRRVLDHFRVTFDHGCEVVFEP